MAPECFPDGNPGAPVVGGSSEESDVYSLAMTSFSVCTVFWKPPYYLKQSSRCNQVLTGALPYYRDDRSRTIASIRSGKRPPHPTGPNQNQWLWDPVWDMITTGWSHEPEKRCDLSVMHDILVTASEQGVYPGDLNN